MNQKKWIVAAVSVMLAAAIAGSVLYFVRPLQKYAVVTAIVHGLFGCETLDKKSCDKYGDCKAVWKSDNTCLYRLEDQCTSYGGVWACIQKVPVVEPEYACGGSDELACPHEFVCLQENGASKQDDGSCRRLTEPGRTKLYHPVLRWAMASPGNEPFNIRLWVNGSLSRETEDVLRSLTDVSWKQQMESNLTAENSFADLSLNKTELIRVIALSQVFSVDGPVPKGMCGGEAVVSCPANRVCVAPPDRKTYGACSRLLPDAAWESGKITYLLKENLRAPHGDALSLRVIIDGWSKELEELLGTLADQSWRTQQESSAHIGTISLIVSHEELNALLSSPEIIQVAEPGSSPVDL